MKESILNVPNLRFPGFEGEWNKVLLENIIDLQSGQDLEPSSYSDDVVGKYPYVTGASSLCEEGIRINRWTNTPTRIAYRGDILLVCKGSGVGTLGQLNNVDEAHIARQIMSIRGKRMSQSFTYFLIQGITPRLKQNATGLIPGIDRNTLLTQSTFIPSIDEQQKISSLLLLLDQRISIQNKVIEDCNTLEKEIQNQVFDQINAPLVPLSSISQRITERNSALESDNVLTISAREGLVSQLEFFKKSVAGENLSNYFLLHKGDFAYNKSYSSDYPWGAIKHLERYDTGVLSPLYFCFRPNKEIVDTRYLQFFFDTKLWHKHIANIAVEGARNHGLLNMAVGDFYTMPILLPTMNEQLAIAEKLSAFRKKRVAEESIYRLLLLQKQYLLKKLFV